MGVAECGIIFHSHDSMQVKHKTLKNTTIKSWKWASSLIDWSCSEGTVLFEMHQVLSQW